MFSHILGNDQIKGYLQHMLETHAVGNSLLFAGIDGIGKSLFAESLAKYLLKTNALSHPDLYIYRPEGKIGMHSIDSMRHFSEKVYMTPFQATYKVFIIHDADRMLPASANALLKTFEEPATDAIIILLSSRMSALLPTILSRCRTIRFHHIPEALIAQYLRQNSLPEYFAALANGSIGQALRLSQENDTIRTQLLAYLSAPSDPFRAARELADLVESAKKQEETELRSHLHADLTAAQQQMLEKEIDGALAMRQATAAQSLFEVILSYYRDRQLLHANANASLLLNKDIALTASPQDPPFSAIQEAKLLLDRSTSLQIVLENLFLKL